MSSLQGKREKYYARKTRKKTFVEAKNEYQIVVSPRQNNITERETENTKYEKPSAGTSLFFTVIIRFLSTYIN